MYQQTLKHTQTVFELTRDDPLAYAHLSFGPYDAVEEYEKLVKMLEEDEFAFAFAILLCDREEEEMVGTIAYYDANTEDRSIEISLVQIFAKHRCRGFAMDAGRLLMEYALTPVVEGGLGLARVEWHASTANLGSIAVARRLGFEEIGVVRYERCLKNGKERGKVGNGRSEVPPGSEPGDLWRDLVMFAVYWDTWGGERRKIS